MINLLIKIKNILIRNIFTLLGVFGLLIVIILLFINNSSTPNKGESYCILKGSKNAKTDKVIRQTGVDKKKIVKASLDTNNGFGFTYSCWLYINTMDYKKDSQLKPVFYKSSKKDLVKKENLINSDYAPGVFLLKSNTLRVIMNTGSNAEMVDITNIPIKKWVHLGLYVFQESMDVYINGQMVDSKRFSKPPKQNDGDIYINTYGGYDGMISDLHFYNYPISYEKLKKIMRKGPSTSSCCSKEIPPYFNNKWWLFN